MTGMYGTPDPHNPLRVTLADLLLVYSNDGKTIRSILDANSPGWNRHQPASLLEVRKAAHREYGKISSRIRCVKCGKRSTSQNRYCPECTAIIEATEQPKERPCSNHRMTEREAEAYARDAQSQKDREDRDLEIDQGGVWLLGYVCGQCGNKMMANGLVRPHTPRVWCPRCHLQVTQAGLAKMFPGRMSA